MSDYDDLREIMEGVRENDEHTIVVEQEEEINRGDFNELNEIESDLRVMQGNDEGVAESGTGKPDQSSESNVIQRDI